MAGDWIKMREDLHEDPAVLQMANKLGARPEHVVGYCHRFWSWVSRNCHDGSVTNVTLVSVESVLGLPNFLHLLCDVGWLEYIESTSGTKILIPNFERHMSQSAKARALATSRKRHARVPKKSRSQRDKNATREEKSITTPALPGPGGSNTSESADTPPPAGGRAGAGGRRQAESKPNPSQAKHPRLPPNIEVFRVGIMRQMAWTADDMDDRAEQAIYEAWVNAGGDREQADAFLEQAVG